MLALDLLIKYRNEIGLGILALLCIAGVLHIKHTYSRVDEQAVEIKRLQGEVNRAKDAIDMHNTVARKLGEIDQKTYSSVRHILRSPVPATLIPSGVRQTVPSTATPSNNRASDNGTRKP